jgi:hypothetical protein
LPAEVADRIVERGVGPRIAAVGADLDALDRRPTRPRAPLEQARALLEEAVPLREVGDPRRDHQRARQHARDRLAELFGGLLRPVLLHLLVALERLGEEGDPLEPLHVRHPVPAWDDQTQRKAVLRRERLAVDLVGEEHLRPARLVEREAPLVRVLDLALEPAVEAGEEHLDGAVLDPGLLEERRERRSCPLCVPDRFVEPRLAERAGREARPAVPGALEGDRDARLRALLDLVQRKRDGVRDRASELQLPTGDVDVRDVEVDQEVVQPERRDVVAKRLEREPVVPQRER